jgi:predicted Zn-dependent protease
LRGPHPDRPQAYATLAGVLNSQVKPAEALVAVDTAIRLEPRNPDLYLLWQGWAYTELGRWKESIPALKRFLSPQMFFVHAWLANDYSSLGDDDAARAEAAEVERVVALTPNSAAGYIPLAWALNSLWKPAEALVAVDSSIRLDHRKCVCHLRFRGIAYTQLGQWQEAIAAFKPYLARFQHDFWAHAYLAIDYMELGHDDAARAEVAEVLRLDPEFSVEIIFPTGSLQSKVPKIDRFESDLRRAGLT